MKFHEGEIDPEKYHARHPFDEYVQKSHLMDVHAVTEIKCNECNQI